MISERELRKRFTYLNHNALSILGLLMEGREKSIPPTHREISARTGCWPHGVVGHLERLKKLGLVNFEFYSARTATPTCVFIPADKLDSA